MTFVHNIFICPRGHSRQSLPGYKPILSYNTWCSRVSNYHYLGYFSRRQKKKKKKSFFFFFFYYQENRVWQSCNGDNLHEMQILFSWKNEKNVSKCRQLKILPRVLGVMVAHWSVHGKTYNKTCTKGRISPHTLSLHISSLIWAFANRMYLLQSLGLTKRLVRRAKTRVNLPTAHSDKSIHWSYLPPIAGLSKAG